jgi:hypothetical protein
MKQVQQSQSVSWAVPCYAPQTVFCKAPFGVFNTKLGFIRPKHHHIQKSKNMTFPRPNNFPYKEVFYSDGEIALIKGRYKDSDHDSIGMRWMVGESELGYPSTFGNPMWMVVPDKLALYILEGVFRDLEKQRKFIIDFQEFMDALEFIRVREQQM